MDQTEHHSGAQLYSLAYFCPAIGTSRLRKTTTGPDTAPMARKSFATPPSRNGVKCDVVTPVVVGDEIPPTCAAARRDPPARSRAAHG